MAKDLTKPTMPNEVLSASNIKPADHKLLAKKPLDPRIERMREEETKLVTGIFRCMEPVGGSVTCSYRKYPGEPIKSYTFEDGKTYTIPLGLARHLNSGCAWPVHKYAIDRDTDKPSPMVGKWVHRFSFSSTDYAAPASNRFTEVIVQ